MDNASNDGNKGNEPGNNLGSNSDGGGGGSRIGNWFNRLLQPLPISAFRRSKSVTKPIYEQRLLSEAYLQITKPISWYMDPRTVGLARKIEDLGLVKHRLTDDLRVRILLADDQSYVLEFKSDPPSKLRRALRRSGFIAQSVPGSHIWRGTDLSKVRVRLESYSIRPNPLHYDLAPDKGLDY
jgi:hypothetical protein